MPRHRGLRRKGRRATRTLPDGTVEVVELQNARLHVGSYYLNIGWRVADAPTPRSWSAVSQPVHLGARAETLLGPENVDAPLDWLWGTLSRWYEERAPVVAREARVGLRRYASRRDGFTVCLVHEGRDVVAVEAPGTLPEARLAEVLHGFHTPWVRQRGQWYCLLTRWPSAEEIEAAGLSGARPSDAKAIGAALRRAGVKPPRSSAKALALSDWHLPLLDGEDPEEVAARVGVDPERARYVADALAGRLA